MSHPSTYTRADHSEDNNDAGRNLTSAESKHRVEHQLNLLKGYVSLKAGLYAPRQGPVDHKAVYLLLHGISTQIELI